MIGMHEEDEGSLSEMIIWYTDIANRICTATTYTIAQLLNYCKQL